MKKLIWLTFISVFLMIIVSCKDDSETINIIGKWELREVSDSNHPLWETVPVDTRDILVFLYDGNFIQTDFRGNPLPDQCFGTYVLVSNTELWINSSCQQHALTKNISLSPDSLIFTLQGREEASFEKYIKVD